MIVFWDCSDIVVFYFVCFFLLLRSFVPPFALLVQHLCTTLFNFIVLYPLPCFFLPLTLFCANPLDRLTLTHLLCVLRENSPFRWYPTVEKLCPISIHRSSRGIISIETNVVLNGSTLIRYGEKKCHFPYLSLNVDTSKVR